MSDLSQARVAASAPLTPAATIRLLRDRNFAPYFLGNLTSNSGMWAQQLALALLVYRLTGSVFLVGLTNFSQFAGSLLLAPWSGPAADRHDRTPSYQA